jgi:hypothetical protein
VRRPSLLALLPLALLATACGAAGPAGSERAGPTPSSTRPQLYEADAVVLEDEHGGPMLCLGAILLSLPAQCGDVPLARWDWDAVEGEESFRKTTWGEYHVVGSYDGKSFTVTEASPPEARPGTEESNDEFASPCPAPEGGWIVPEPEASTQEDVRAAAAYASAQPDYVVSWVTHLEERLEEFGPVIFNAIFTGRTAEHEAEIRKRWDGPLCVVERDLPTRRELARIRSSAEASLEGLGLKMLWSDDGGVKHQVRIGVIADPDGNGQAALDARFGEGLVLLFPALRPVN